MYHLPSALAHLLTYAERKICFVYVGVIFYLLLKFSIADKCYTALVSTCTTLAI